MNYKILVVPNHASDLKISDYVARSAALVYMYYKLPLKDLKFLPNCCIAQTMETLATIAYKEPIWSFKYKKSLMKHKDSPLIWVQAHLLTAEHNEPNIEFLQYGMGISKYDDQKNKPLTIPGSLTLLNKDRHFLEGRGSGKNWIQKIMTFCRGLI